MSAVLESNNGTPAFLENRSVRTIADFKHWTRARIRPLLPHESLACGHYHVHSGGITIDCLVTVDYPVAHLYAIRDKAGGVDSPILRRWIANGEPQLFDADHPWSGVAPEWLRQFRASGLKNALAHAYYDRIHCVGTYFSFHRLPGALGQSHVERAKQLVPRMHESLCRAVAHDRTAQRRPNPLAALTERECAIVRCLGAGKSNAEIAALAALSEITVKHHLTRIFQKTGVSNRAQLIRLLAEHELGEAPRHAARIY